MSKRVSNITKKSSGSSASNGLKKRLSRSICNSLPLSSFHHQFLESTPLGWRHLLRERNFSLGWRLWCNGARQSRGGSQDRQISGALKSPLESTVPLVLR